MKDACEMGEVILAVGSAQESNTPGNPFTAGERIEMWHRVLEASGLSAIFVTLPDGPDNQSWVENVKRMCPPFDRVVTGDLLSQKLLSGAGLKVEPPSFFERSAYSGTSVRDLILKGDASWKRLVPKAVLEFLEEIHGAERIKAIGRG